jgi:CheY-like chemotaxis protein
MGENTQNSIKILIIDDEKPLLENLEELFQMYGYAVKAVTNGYEGILELMESEIHLIISDIYMPEMSGFEFLEKIKPFIETNSIPIIFWSADFSDEIKQKLVNNGALTCFQKGIPFSELLHFIESEIL